MRPTGRSAAGQSAGLQFIVEQIGELYGVEQVLLKAEQDIASRTTLTDFRTNLERFVGDDRQHLENLLQALRMMLGGEGPVQSAIERGHRRAEAILGSTQTNPFDYVRGLVLLVSDAALSGRILLQVQQRIDNQEILSLLETNHYQDAAHLRDLQSQLDRAAEELSGLPIAR
jgi:hypothetical protein